VVPVDTQNRSTVGGSSGVKVDPKFYTSKEELIEEFTKVVPGGLAALSGNIDDPQHGAEGRVNLTEKEAIQLGLTIV
jgi:hypothetical protein